jgi:hypothetical protein
VGIHGRGEGLLTTRLESGPDRAGGQAGAGDAAQHSGTFTWPVNRQPFPVVQLLMVGDLLSGQRPKMPTPFLPYIQAKRLAAPTEQLTLG